MFFFEDHNVEIFVLSQINMKGLDGIQGPVYVGTGCVFRRQALYGYNPPKGSKRPKMVSCDCCPCFGRRKKHRFSKDGLAENALEGGKFGLSLVPALQHSGFST